MATSTVFTSNINDNVKTINGRPVLAIHEQKYGTHYVTGHNVNRDIPQLPTYYQEYTYVSLSDGKVTEEQIHAASTTDTSRPTNRATEYNTKCSCCWLNIGHTIEKHNAMVEGFNIDGV